MKKDGKKQMVTRRKRQAKVCSWASSVRGLLVVSVKITEISVTYYTCYKKLIKCITTYCTLFSTSLYAQLRICSHQRINTSTHQHGNTPTTQQHIITTGMPGVAIDLVTLSFVESIDFKKIRELCKEDRDRDKEAGGELM